MIDSGLALGGVPREQKMLKGYLPRVIYHQVYQYTKIIRARRVRVEGLGLRRPESLILALQQLAAGRKGKTLNVLSSYTKVHSVIYDSGSVPE